MTSLMLRGSESRAIRQPPSAPCITGVCGTRETTADRRLAGGSSRCFPTAGAVCCSCGRSIGGVSWRCIPSVSKWTPAGGRVLVDGVIFPYAMADRQPYLEVSRDDLGIVWVPLIADEIVFRAGVEVSQCSSKPRLK